MTYLERMFVRLEKATAGMPWKKADRIRERWRDWIWKPNARPWFKR